MRLQNVLALTHGELVNEPFVSSFSNIVFESKNVKKGDLFIAFDENMIEDAVLNGAYGIIFSKPTQISDNEIAWIKVQEIENSIKRLLRFKLIDKNITVYKTNEVVLKLALQVITEPNFIAVNGDIKNISKQLWNIEESATLLFCPSLTDEKIFTNIIDLPNTLYEDINIVEQTLFETSFIYDNIFYERQLISPFFIPYLETLLHLFKNLKINYRLKKFTQIDHFKAVFTNKNFEIKEFGTSDKVLIFEKNTHLIEQEVLFLQKEASWAKILYVLPLSNKNLIDKIKDKNKLITYSHKSEIISLLKLHHFHFALIVGAQKDILLTNISNSFPVSLFDFK